MTRGDGWATMDLSTAICADPKFKRLARLYPEYLAAGFMVYVATLADSWRDGARVSAEDAWPPILGYDGEISKALVDVGLLDKQRRVSARAWAQWFSPAQQRRASSRARWQRANQRRNDAATT